MVLKPCTLYQNTGGPGNTFLDNSSEFLCPVCRQGLLIYRDHCRRIVRQDGGESEWIHIPRHQCSNPKCRRIHRMLPDFLVPFKHYQEAVVVDAVDDRLLPEDADDRPSRQTVCHWKWWIQLNASDIEGQMRSVAHRELGYTEELLRSSVPLLSYLRSSVPEGWLKLILRIIYNSGARLCPVYS